MSYIGEGIDEAVTPIGGSYSSGNDKWFIHPTSNVNGAIVRTFWSDDNSSSCELYYGTNTGTPTANNKFARGLQSGTLIQNLYLAPGVGLYLEGTGSNYCTYDLL